MLKNKAGSIQRSAEQPASRAPFRASSTFALDSQYTKSNPMNRSNSRSLNRLGAEMLNSTCYGLKIMFCRSRHGMLVKQCTCIPAQARKCPRLHRRLELQYVKRKPRPTHLTTVEPESLSFDSLLTEAEPSLQHRGIAQYLLKKTALVLGNVVSQNHKSIILLKAELRAMPNLVQEVRSFQISMRCALQCGALLTSKE